MTLARPLIVSLLLGLAACGQEVQNGEKYPTGLDLWPLIHSPSTTTASLSVIKARTSRSRLSRWGGGKLISRAVDVGVSVKKGDLLARLDEQDYHKLRLAEADVASATAVLTEAQGSEGRLRQLITTGATTRANYDAALKNLRSAEASSTPPRPHSPWPRTKVTYADLRADFDGIVTAIGAEPGKSSTSARWLSAWHDQTIATRLQIAESPSEAVPRVKNPKSSSRCSAVRTW